MDTTGTTAATQAKDGGLPIQEPTITTSAPALKPHNSRTRYITNIPGESACDTSQGNDTDINHIVARFDRTGELPPPRPGQYVDCTELQGDLTEMLEKARNIEATAKDFIEQWQPKDEILEQEQPATESPPPA